MAQKWNLWTYLDSYCRWHICLENCFQNYIMSFRFHCKRILIHTLEDLVHVQFLNYACAKSGVFFLFVFTGLYE
jgi:hypothetical protein